MKIPEKCPSIDAILESGAMDLSADAINYAKEYNGRYLHWNDLKYREFGESNRVDVWKLMKVARLMSYRYVRIADLELSYSPADDYIQRTLHGIDSRIVSGSSISDGVDDKRRTTLSVSSMMEESIASSQLEGASTTTKLAKKLLRSDLQPQDDSQRMVVNNYRAMQLIKNRSGEPLTHELIKEIHRTVVDGLMEDPNDLGRFRDDDSIAVKDVYDDVVYHVPVEHELIDRMVDDLCRYANDGTDSTHPIIKGVIIHYVFAYIHPFLDGNGRVSRALFYWYCMKNGYSMIEYLSISKVIKKHRGGYDAAFLLSETDGGDMTYFIRYNLEMISEAIRLFDSYMRRKTMEREEALKDPEMNGLNNRQLLIVKDMARSGESLSQYELAVKYQMTVSTIRRDLMKLMEMGMVRESGKDGHRQLYVYDPEHRGFP